MGYLNNAGSTWRATDRGLAGKANKLAMKPTHVNKCAARFFIELFHIFSFVPLPATGASRAQTIGFQCRPSTVHRPSQKTLAAICLGICWIQVSLHVSVQSARSRIPSELTTAFAAPRPQVLPVSWWSRGGLC